MLQIGMIQLQCIVAFAGLTWEGFTFGCAPDCNRISNKITFKYIIAVIIITAGSVQSFWCSGIRFIALALSKTCVAMWCLGVATRTKVYPFAATYRLGVELENSEERQAWQWGAGRCQTCGEENAAEKLEIIAVSDVLVRGIVLENGNYLINPFYSWSALCLPFVFSLQSTKTKTKLRARASAAESPA